jgi:hypothetical protein
MPYAVKQISFDAVEVAYWGRVAEADTSNATDECVQLQRRLSILKFVAVVAEDAEIEMQPDRVRELAGSGYRRRELRRATRIAVVRPKSERALRFVEAFEEASRKRGWNVRVLPDRTAALQWLDAPAS